MCILNNAMVGGRNGRKAPSPAGKKNRIMLLDLTYNWNPDEQGI
jgi:hypothetical protein